jgi:predicted DCC family thiol-disulfide oxidoreductase YuxK
VLLYDGLCGFCDRTVQFILARDPGGMMRFAPLQGEFARDVLRRHPSLHGVDSLVWVEARATSTGASPLVRSDAILAVADYLGWPWRAAVMFRIVPRFLRDWAYDLFARYRYQLFGRFNACPLPSPDVRARFID